MCARTGSRFFGLVSAMLIRDNKGNPLAIRAATVDLTERKRLHDAEMKAEAAEEANRLRTEFLNLISHEFRTPLGVVLGVADALQAHTDADGKQYLAMLETNGNRLLQMLNNVLELAKTEATANEPPLFQYLDVQHFFSTLHKQWESQLQAHAIEYLPELSPTLPTAVLTDILRLERILHSLFDNAVKFTEHVFVRLAVQCVPSPNTPNAATLHIRLQDTGVGIPPEHLNNIFEPFYQAHRGTTREYDGTGIGLAVVRGLVKQMRGTIQISSVVASGTTATLTVPILLTPSPTLSEAQNGFGNEKKSGSRS